MFVAIIYAHRFFKKKSLIHNDLRRKATNPQLPYFCLALQMDRFLLFSSHISFVATAKSSAFVHTS